MYLFLSTFPAYFASIFNINHTIPVASELHVRHEGVFVKIYVSIYIRHIVRKGETIFVHCYFFTKSFFTVDLEFSFV